MNDREKIKVFFSEELRKLVPVRAVEKMAEVPEKTLNHFLAGRRDLLDSQVTKIKSVLKKIGLQLNSTVMNEPLYDEFDPNQYAYFSLYEKKQFIHLSTQLSFIKLEWISLESHLLPNTEWIDIIKDIEFRIVYTLNTDKRVAGSLRLFNYLVEQELQKPIFKIGKSLPSINDRKASKSEYVNHASIELFIKADKAKTWKIEPVFKFAYQSIGDARIGT